MSSGRNLLHYSDCWRSPCRRSEGAKVEAKNRPQNLPHHVSHMDRAKQTAMLPAAAGQSSQLAIAKLDHRLAWSMLISVQQTLPCTADVSPRCRRMHWSICGWSSPCPVTCTQIEISFLRQQLHTRNKLPSSC